MHNQPNSVHPSRIRVAQQKHIADLHGRTTKSRRRIKRLIATAIAFPLIGEKSHSSPHAVALARRLATDLGFTPPKPGPGYVLEGREWVNKNQVAEAAS